MALAAIALSGAACVEPFEGTWTIMRLGGGAQPPGSGAPGQPPDGTHYEMWVFSSVPGDGTGPAPTNAFKVYEFTLVPIFDPEFPCFIETDKRKGEEFLGVHISHWYEKNLEVVMADGTISDDEYGRLADADTRAFNIEERKDALVVVAPFDPTVTPAVLTELEETVDNQAPITDISDAANKKRLEICQRFFEDHPNYYVGNDLIFSVPISGVYLGINQAKDPISSADVGGAAFAIPYSFEKFDMFQISWQFDDLNDPRIQQFGPAPTGYHYMSGTPEYRTRRTINVALRNQSGFSISGDIAFFPNIEEDQAIF